MFQELLFASCFLRLTGFKIKGPKIFFQKLMRRLEILGARQCRVHFTVNWRFVLGAREQTAPITMKIHAAIT